MPESDEEFLRRNLFGESLEKPKERKLGPVAGVAKIGAKKLVEKPGAAAELLLSAGLSGLGETVGRGLAAPAGPVASIGAGALGGGLGAATVKAGANLFRGEPISKDVNKEFQSAFKVSAGLGVLGKGLSKLAEKLGPTVAAFRKVPRETTETVSGGIKSGEKILHKEGPLLSAIEEDADKILDAFNDKIPKLGKAIESGEQEIAKKFAKSRLSLADLKLELQAFATNELKAGEPRRTVQNFINKLPDTVSPGQAKRLQNEINEKVKTRILKTSEDDLVVGQLKKSAQSLGKKFDAFADPEFLKLKDAFSRVKEAQRILLPSKGSGKEQIAEKVALREALVKSTEKRATFSKERLALEQLGNALQDWDTQLKSVIKRGRLSAATLEFIGAVPPELSTAATLGLFGTAASRGLSAGPAAAMALASPGVERLLMQQLIAPTGFNIPTIGRLGASSLVQALRARESSK